MNITITGLYVYGKEVKKFGKEDLAQAMECFKTHPLFNDSYKAIGIAYEGEVYPGSIDILCCKDGELKISNDYKYFKLDENAEVQEIVKKLSTAL